MKGGITLRPRKMKEVELTVLRGDMDAVIEFLGRRALMHFSDENDSTEPLSVSSEAHVLDKEVSKRIRGYLDSIAAAAAWLALPLPLEPMESSRFPGEEEEALATTITQSVSLLSSRENKLLEEKRKMDEALNEANAFANLNAPFSDLDQLSYLTLRVGRLDSKRMAELQEGLSGRAVIIPLGSGEDAEGRVLAAASRKGRFALDSELKKAEFAPIIVPDGYKGIPSELLSGLEEKLKVVVRELEEIDGKKEKLREEYAESLQTITASYLMADIAEKLKARVVATKSAYILSGWVPMDMIQGMVVELEKLSEGRVAIRSYDPEELQRVRDGREKVPVSLRHGAFVKGFEPLVFSYGAPLYGTIDPTPIVAFFFTMLFGIMFGDLGQGFVLFLLGILTGKKGPALLSRFRHFSVPLVAVGLSSMVMGFLNGSVFTNEEILEGPTHVITGLLTGHPVDRILTVMPLAEKGGSITKLFYFFGFTIAVGVILNTLGLIVNMVNLFSRKKYKDAVFSKTGLAGFLFFWYALSIGLRALAALIRPELFSFKFYWFDLVALILPLLAIVLGPMLWRLFSGERPVLAEGFMVFFVEGFVEFLETISTYFSNTMSFLRVGAFALSHAVLSYIVFRFSEEVSSVTAGTLFSLLILVFGNLVIILLEGMIVAIQVVRLQYYEFFSKFFTETGVEFAPFAFRKKN